MKVTVSPNAADRVFPQDVVFPQDRAFHNQQRMRPAANPGKIINRYSQSVRKVSESTWIVLHQRLGLHNTVDCRMLFGEFLSGWGGIRTPGPVSRSAVFKTAAFDHSATHPKGLVSAWLSPLESQGASKRNLDCWELFCKVAPEAPTQQMYQNGPWRQTAGGGYRVAGIFRSDLLQLSTWSRKDCRMV